MSGYVRNIIIKKVFDGDTVTVVMSPISFGDMLAMTRYIKDGRLAIPVDELESFIGKAKSYTKSLAGLKTDQAEDVSIDELYESAYFIELMTDVLGEWLKKANPANPPSPDASPSA